MRFRFCGDQDCPDWLLAEINLITKISSVKMKLVASNVLNDLLGAPLDYDKLTKLTADAKFGPGDLETSVACVAFVLLSAARFDVESEALSSELQQLGLPKEHAVALCKAYDGNTAALRDVLASKTLNLWKLRHHDWRIDYVLSSSALKSVAEPSLQLKLDVQSPMTGAVQTSRIALTANQVDELLYELRQAASVMQKIES